MSNLTIFCIEYDLVKEIKWEKLLQKCATIKSRKNVFREK